MQPERVRTVTIRDVAREARVSAASASRALSGPASVTEAMRDRGLTTVSVRIADLSRRALECLAGIVDGSNADEPQDLLVTVRPEVVARESSAPSNRPAQAGTQHQGRNS